jgi:hypothetical protein
LPGLAPIRRHKEMGLIRSKMSVFGEPFLGQVVRPKGTFYMEMARAWLNVHGQCLEQKL